MTSSEEIVKIARTFLGSAGSTSSAAKNMKQIAASFKLPRNIRDIIANASTKVRRLIREAAAVLAQSHLNGVTGTTTLPPPNRSTGETSLYGIVIPLPRSLWKEADPGPDYLAVPIALAKQKKSRSPALAGARLWEVILPLDVDDQVFLFTEEILLNYHTQAGLVLEEVEVPEVPTPPLFMEPLISSTPSISPQLPIAAPLAAAPCSNIVKPCIDIAIFGLGAHCHSSPATILALFKTFAATVLQINDISGAAFVKLNFRQSHHYRQKPDIIILNVPQQLKEAIWKSKRCLQFWLPVSIDVHRAPDAHWAHITERRIHRITPTSSPLYSPIACPSIIPPPPPPSSSSSSSPSKPAFNLSSPIFSTFCNRPPPPRHPPRSHTGAGHSGAPPPPPPPPPVLPLPPAGGLHPADDDGAGPSNAPQRQ